MRFLAQGPGFGGRLLQKDISTWFYLFRHYGWRRWPLLLRPVGWSSTNGNQQRIARLVAQRLFRHGPSRPSGFERDWACPSFKADTNDTHARTAPDHLRICRSARRRRPPWPSTTPKVSTARIQSAATPQLSGCSGERTGAASGMSGEGSWRSSAKRAGGCRVGATAVVVPHRDGACRPTLDWLRGSRATLCAAAGWRSMPGHPSQRRLVGWLPALRW